jgi:hypothetical protein
LNDKKQIAKLNESGFDEYFIKPIDVNKISNFIKNI